jgi:Protein of unknown function (DUF5818)
VRQHRTWFSVLSYCLLMGLAAALVFAIIIAGGSVALASHQGATEATDGEASPATPAPRVETKFTGMITDSHCGARHMRRSNMTPEECARACYRKGASYVLVDGGRRYTLIGGEDALDKLLGQRATVTGKRQDDDAILVDSAAPAL